MAENTTLEQLQQEYQVLCAKAGELQYQAKQITSMLNQANQKIEQVNKKYASIKEASLATVAKESQEIVATAQEQAGVADVAPQS